MGTSSHGRLVSYAKRGRLIARDDRGVVGVLVLYQQADLVLDAVHRIEGDHGPGPVQRLKQRAEGGRLVRLGTDLPLGEGDRGRGMTDGRQQVPVALGQVCGAGQRLALHRGRPPGHGCGLHVAAVVFGQVSAHGRVQGVTVDGGQDPGEDGGRGAR